MLLCFHQHSQIKRFSDPRIIIIGGSVLSIASMIGLGPVMTVWPSLPVLLLCQAGFGLGLGPAFVCSYLHSVKISFVPMMKELLTNKNWEIY